MTATINDTVAALDLYQVEWPIKMTRRHGVGDVAGTVPGVILRLRTKFGLEGWGEAAPWAVFTGTVEATFHALDRYLRPLVVGSSLADAQTICAAAERNLVGHPEAKAALSMALEDLRGKTAGLPCAEMLGGVYRRTVPLSVSIANPDFDADMEFLRQRLAEGVRLFKVKTGFLDHSQDLKRLRSVKDALPVGASLRIDYNQGLESWNALPRLLDVQAFEPEFIEQPVPRDRRDTMAELCRALRTPILADESVFTPAEAIEMVRNRFADAVSIKLMKCGGLQQAKAIASIAGAAGIPAYGGTMYEGGIALAAGLHLACSTPNISLGAELYTARYVLATDVLQTPLDIRDGHVFLNDLPGLGVVVDMDQLRNITRASAT